ERQAGDGEGLLRIARCRADARFSEALDDSPEVGARGVREGERAPVLVELRDPLPERLRLGAVDGDPLRAGACQEVAPEPARAQEREVLDLEPRLGREGEGIALDLRRPEDLGRAEQEVDSEGRRGHARGDRGEPFALEGLPPALVLEDRALGADREAELLLAPAEGRAQHAQDGGDERQDGLRHARAPGSSQKIRCSPCRARDNAARKREKCSNGTSWRRAGESTGWTPFRARRNQRVPIGSRSVARPGFAVAESMRRHLRAPRRGSEKAPLASAPWTKSPSRKSRFPRRAPRRRGRPGALVSGVAPRSFRSAPKTLPAAETWSSPLSSGPRPPTRFARPATLSRRPSRTSNAAPPSLSSA